MVVSSEHDLVTLLGDSLPFTMFSVALLGLGVYARIFRGGYGGILKVGRVLPGLLCNDASRGSRLSNIEATLGFVGITLVGKMTAGVTSGTIVSLV